jgi:hypothetical protein
MSAGIEVMRAAVEGGLCTDMINATRGSRLTNEYKEFNTFLAKVGAPVEHPSQSSRGLFHAASHEQRSPLELRILINGSLAVLSC